MQTDTKVFIGMISLLLSAACSSNVTTPGGSSSSTSVGGSPATGTGGAPGVGGGGSGGAPATHCGDTLTVDSFKDCVAETFCQALKPCCQSDAFGFDESNCESRVARFVGQNSPSKPADGRFDLANGKACVEAAAKVAGSCPEKADESLAFLNACSFVFTGTVAPGAACSKDQDCAPPAGGGLALCFAGGVCSQYSRGKAGDACVMSYASTRKPNGETEVGVETANPAATSGIECNAADGLTCDFNNLAGPNPQCIALGIAAAPCLNTDDCAAGFNCIKADPTADKGACTAKLAIGDTCDSQGVNGCAAGGFCDAMTNKCAAQAVLGAACKSGEGCKTGVCSEHHCADYLVNVDICKGN